MTQIYSTRLCFDAIKSGLRRKINSARPNCIRWSNSSRATTPRLKNFICTENMVPFHLSATWAELSRASMARRKNRPEKRRGPFRRQAGTRDSFKMRFLIVCEGVETEPNYFRAFCVDKRVNAEVKIKGTGFNTLSLVDECIRLRNE